MSLASVIGTEQELLWPTYDAQKVPFTGYRGGLFWDSSNKRYREEAYAHA